MSSSVFDIRVMFFEVQASIIVQLIIFPYFSQFLFHDE